MDTLRAFVADHPVLLALPAVAILVAILVSLGYSVNTPRAGVRTDWESDE